MLLKFISHTYWKVDLNLFKDWRIATYCCIFLQFLQKSCYPWDILRMKLMTPLGARSMMILWQIIYYLARELLRYLFSSEFYFISKVISAIKGYYYIVLLIRTIDLFFGKFVSTVSLKSFVKLLLHSWMLFFYLLLL